MQITGKNNKTTPSHEKHHTNITPRQRDRFLDLCCGFLLATAVVTQAAGNKTGVPVYPPNAKPYGKSLTEWTMEQFKWVNSIPAPSPLFHLDADTCVNQDGPVWFLADSGVAPGAPEDFRLTRYCTVPVGKAIYVPVLTLWSFVCPEWEVTDEQIIEGARDFRTLAQDIRAEVDGVEIPNLDDYEFITPVFDAAQRDDSEWSAVFPILNCPVFRLVIIGQAIMLPPLPVGEHTVRFQWVLVSELCGGGCGFIDITYRLNVAPQR